MARSFCCSAFITKPHWGSQNLVVDRPLPKLHSLSPKASRPGPGLMYYSNYQNRTRRAADQLFRHAANQEMFEAGSTVSRHYDQVDLLVARIFGNRYNRMTDTGYKAHLG